LNALSFDGEEGLQARGKSSVVCKLNVHLRSADILLMDGKSAITLPASSLLSIMMSVSPPARLAQCAA
jgi:hypothetical protein